MGVTYSLINRTKKEIISFIHVPAAKAREIAGNSIAASITTWYMLNHINDDITFLPETDYIPEIADYEDVTDSIIDDLIAKEIFADEGIRYVCDDEPELYFRKIRNIWDYPTR